MIPEENFNSLGLALPPAPTPKDLYKPLFINNSIVTFQGMGRLRMIEFLFPEE